MNTNSLDTHAHIAALDCHHAPMLLVSSMSCADNYLNIAHCCGRGFGVHPLYASELDETGFQEITRLIQTPGTFIGEIGIDMRSSVLEVQQLDAYKKCFERLARLAFAHGKLVSLHVVSRGAGCWDYLLGVFQNLEAEFGGTYIIFHAFNGSRAVFDRFRKACPLCRFFIGVGWLNLDNQRTIKALKNQIVLETDMYEPQQDYDALWAQVSQLENDDVRANNAAIIAYMRK